MMITTGRLIAHRITLVVRSSRCERDADERAAGGRSERGRRRISERDKERKSPRQFAGFRRTKRSIGDENRAPAGGGLTDATMQTMASSQLHSSNCSESSRWGGEVSRPHPGFLRKKKKKLSWFRHKVTRSETEPRPLPVPQSSSVFAVSSRGNQRVATLNN